MGVMSYLDILEDELLANKSIKLDKKDNKTVTAVYNNTMSGLKESLTDIVDILKDIKKEEKEDVN